MQPPQTPPVRVGVSACLLGERVRYDGGHKRDSFLTEIFGRYVELVPVCPEVELGLGVPREPIRLERRGGEIRLLSWSGQDLSERMRTYAHERARSLGAKDLCGYVLKKSSPSCGYEGVKVHGLRGRPARNGRGFFAQALRERFPLLPIEEEGRLCDPELRHNFITRVFAFRKLKTLFSLQSFSLENLVKFHAAHRLLLVAQALQGWRALERLISEAEHMPPEVLRERYQTGFMKSLEKVGAPARHVIVLQHMVGCCEEQLDDDERARLAQLIEEYREGLVPLVVPLASIRYYARALGQHYLTEQAYLEPYPEELMRNADKGE